MLATRVRDSPCRALLSRSSSGRLMRIEPSSARSIVMGSTRVWFSVPFGPFTVTSRPEIVTSTPDGTGMGIFPIRDIWLLPSPDVGEDFPAHASLGGLPIGEQAG